MISIIIPAWNTENTIANTLESIFWQTFSDYEIIVVNDGSTDNTQKILETFESRIKIIRQENHGANCARNQGWRAAKGEYLFFMDSDITLKKDCLEKLLAALKKHPESAYAYCSFKFGKITFKLWPFSHERLQKMPYIHTGALIRVKDFPGFDETVGRLQDWDLWLTMLERGKSGVWLPEVLFKVALRKNGISQWVPRWFYWIPWKIIGWKPKRVLAYETAVEKIKKKHNIKV